MAFCNEAGGCVMAFSDNSSATAARWRRRCRGNRDRTWRHGSRFLLSIAGACAAAAIVLRLAASFEMAKAGGLWTDYGLMLMVAAAIFAVLAAFKNYAERQNTKIVLIADEQQSFWSHAA